MAASPADLLAAALRRAPAAPLITFYDGASGERVELSARTLDNWVSKTAGLLQDEFDVGPGSRVAVALPVHWQTAVVLLGIWQCGAAVLDGAPEDDQAGPADLVVAARDRLEAMAEAEPPELLGLSLDPLGRGLAGYVGPARDFAVEVRLQPDVFVPLHEPEPGSAGLLAGGLRLTLAGLVETATALAGRWGLTGGDRLLVEETAAALAGPVTWLLAPLAAGASLVICRHADADRLAAWAAQERVTVTLGADVGGIRAAGPPA